MKKAKPRERILDAAVELVHRKGFNHTGIQEILDAAGVPKGSFYFYFKSKEELGLALVDHYAQLTFDRAKSCFEDATKSPLERLRLFFQEACARLETEGCQKGCLIGNLSQEMSDLSIHFRQKLESVMELMAKETAGILREARESGELSAHLDLEETARFIISSWQGAILTMKLEKTVEPLIRFERFIFGEILSDRPSGGSS